MSKTFELCDRLVSWDCVDINEYKRFYDESIEAGENVSDALISSPCAEEYKHLICGHGYAEGRYWNIWTVDLSGNAFVTDEAGEATYNLSEMRDLTTGAGEKINERLP